MREDKNRILNEIRQDAINTLETTHRLLDLCCLEGLLRPHDQPQSSDGYKKFKFAFSQKKSFHLFLSRRNKLESKVV